MFLEFRPPEMPRRLQMYVATRQIHLTVDRFSQTSPEMFIPTTIDATKTLSVSRADDVHTFLSAAITNEQTCLEGLKSTASENGLSGDLFIDTKLYGVSLALFSKGWVPRRKRSRAVWKPEASFKRFSGFRNGRSPLKMTERTRAVYNTVTRSGRKLLQTGADAVQVSDIVTVNQNGTGNFTTINEAVVAAPNKTDGSNGHFLIYVTAGLYEEYVEIPKYNDDDR
ncbi:hypothetical protein Bca52824_050075 [Brassica carinata]|uniref:Pectinesterase n=1 Tax=Brassica carinata TaxID=52824 RepID=A0A8X7RLJ3_BRACI|nr:hypothetical protein Bca52824_050075 [Brassica carinata]